MIKVETKTSFESPIEQELYLKLLGAKETSFDSDGRPVFQYKELLFSLDREYRCIRCESSSINGELKDYVLQTKAEEEALGEHFAWDFIFTIEGLVYTFAKLFHNDELEGYYTETLKSLKAKAIVETFKELNSSYLDSIDNEAIKPTLDAFKKVMRITTEQEANKFANVFSVNTTGVYSRDDVDNRIKFYFFTPDEKERYEITSYGDNKWDFCTSVKSGGYLALKIRNDKPYITKMENYNSHTWDLEEMLVNDSFAVDDEKRPWRKATAEELGELILTIKELNDSVALIDLALAPKGKRPKAIRMADKQ